MLHCPASTDREIEWSRWLAHRWGGIAEYLTADGSRADIVTGSTAWEVEWAKKWQQAIGQALWYATATDRQPGVVLLLRRKTTERLYVARCAGACRIAAIRFRAIATR